MRRREFLASVPAANAQMRPNVVIILAGDKGDADAGFQGRRDIPTPNLDRLAASGVRFTNAHVPRPPFCSPTRAGLMTDRRPSHR
jgi:arylsulfatase A-like enzyme